MKKTGLLVICFLCFCLTSNSQTKINKPLVRANLEFLASDELEGREAATRGERISSLYIAKEFQKYGIKPFGDSNTFFQNFELKSAKADRSSKMSLGNEELVLGEDFVFFNKKTSDIIKTGKVVFAGYGISAEEFDYDNYADLDVKGKSVMVIDGEPYSEDNNYFGGTGNTKYSHYWHKVQNAASKGATALIFLIESERKQNMYWSYLVDELDKPALVFDKGKNNPLIMSFSFDMLHKIFEDEDISRDDLLNYMSENKTPSSFELKKELKFDLRFESNEKKLRNVVGYVEGTDSKLKNEFVIVTAHYDHVGLRSPDEVFNGADDNGSGTVAVMEVARLFVENPPKRSVIFSLFAAEEKGLIGSDVFTDSHPSIENTMVNINLDMVGRGSLDTLFSIGESKISSDLKKIIETVDEEMNEFDIDFSQSDSGLFFQSDHYNFHKKNIPSLFLNDMDFSDLHQTTDEVSKIKWEKLYKSIDFTYRLVKKLANMEGELIPDKISK